MKKLVSIALAVFVLAVSICGCAKTPSSSQQGASSAAADSSEAASQPEERYTFKIAKALSGVPDDNSAVETYWEEKLNCNFEILYLETANYAELLNLELSGGSNIPDVFSSSTSRATMVGYYNQGYLGGFTKEFLKENAPLIYDEIEKKAGDVGFAVATIDSLMYTLPQVNVNAMYPPPTIWNLDWLKAVGFEGTPTTLNEFKDVLYKFANNDPDGNGKKDTYGFSSGALSMFYGAFGVAEDIWLEQSDGTLAYDIMQEGGKDALAFLAQMYADGILDPEFITGENKGGYWAISHSFAEERIGLTGLGQFYHWCTPEAVEMGCNAIATPTVLPETNPDLQFGFGDAPVGPDGKFGTPTGAAAYPDCVFSKQFVADEARFKKFLSICETTGGYKNVEDYFVSYLGIENEHWEYKNDIPMVKEEFSAVDSYCARGANGMLAFSYASDAYKKANGARFVWADKQYGEIKTHGYTNALIDVLPSQGDYLDEVTTLLDDAKIAIITGEQPISYYDTVVEQFNSIGGDVLTKEANEIYKAS